MLFFYLHSIFPSLMKYEIKLNLQSLFCSELKIISENSGRGFGGCDAGLSFKHFHYRKLFISFQSMSNSWKT